MKKTLAILLCLLVALSVLAGCGGSKEESAAEPAPAAEAAPAAAAAPAPDAAPAGDASGEMGEGSGETSGDPPAMRNEPLDPKGYSADFAGYQAYVLSAIEKLEAESGFDLSAFKDEVGAAADENAAVFGNMHAQNTIVTYADFIAANG